MQRLYEYRVERVCIEVRSTQIAIAVGRDVNHGTNTKWKSQNQFAKSHKEITETISKILKKIVNVNSQISGRVFVDEIYIGRRIISINTY